MTKPSLTIFMPAYNEADKIRDACESTIRALKKAGVSDYEIFLSTVTSPDGTHDGTPNVAGRLVKENPRVRSFHTFGFLGLGSKYREALRKSTKDYIMMVPGDNDTIEESLVGILNHLGESEAIVVYTANPKARPFRLRFVSKCFVILCNILFGLHMRYYNGMNIFPVKLVKTIPVSTDNPAYMAETLIYLLKSGIRYIEVPQELKYTPYAGKTFRFKSAVRAFGTLCSLFWRISIKRERIKLSF